MIFLAISFFLGLVIGAIAGAFLAWDLYFQSKLHAERRNRRTR